MSKCINNNLVKVQFVSIGKNSETQTKQTRNKDLHVFRSKLSTKFGKKIGDHKVPARKLQKIRTLK